MDIVSGVGVLDKAMTVLRAIVDDPQTLAQLQRSTGLPRATAHRMAAALEVHGMLRRDDDGRFELGHALVPLGVAAQARFPLVDLARPVLSALRDVTGESTQLFVLEGTQRRCVLSLESAHGLRWIVPEGSVFPLDAGSAGRALSAPVPESGSDGWIESVGEREPGVASVSAAVLGPTDAVVAAVSVSGPIERLGHRPGERFGFEVVVAAAELTRALGA